MKRLLPLLLLALTYAAYVRAADPAYQKKIDALMKQASADRKAKGLDRDRTKLFAAYPTPELTLKAVDACPGATVPIAITGKFPEGTGFVVQSDDVEVKDEKSSANSWTAKLAVKPTATPHTVVVLAVSPVSGAQRAFTALEIGCKQVWSLVLDNGEVLTVRSAFKGGKSAPTEGDWAKPGAKGEKSTWELGGTGGSFTFERVASQAETMARMKAMQQAMASPQAKELNQRRTAATKKLQECTTTFAADVPKMAQCLQPVQTELTAIGKAQETLLKGGGASGPKIGCEQLTVDALDGKLTGMAERCADGKSHQVTGTVKAEG